jgi:glutathione S-transferase|tara:strand:+ start:1269 stop:2120 length:852 start_codon:yes stop_codon:yes gene_type:complete
MKLLDSDIKTREILEWKGIHLLNYQFSACSMKTRIYLNLKNIPFKSHQINLSAGENFSQWFQGINPRSLVPVLIHDGDVHIESNDILQYLEGCFENNPLIPADKKMKVSELLSFEDNLHIDIRNITFRFMVPKLLNKGKKAKPKSNDKATLNGEADPLDDVNRNFWKEYEEFGIKDEDVTESLSKMNSALKNIDSILNGNEYILGSNLSVIDIAWFIYVTRIQHANYPLQERHPNVYEWYKRLYKNKKFKDEVQIPLIMKLVINLYALFLKIKGRGITNFLPQ